MSLLASKEPAQSVQLITNEIRSSTRTSPLNRLPEYDGDVIFDKPLVNFADGNDAIFTEYKSIIDSTHLTPREALAMAGGKNAGDLPARLSVISWILPVTKKTRQTNRQETAIPSRPWSHTRWYGEQFNDALCESMWLNCSAAAATWPPPR